MKRKTTIAYAIALAIVGLLITSAAGLSSIGLPATRDIEKTPQEEVADFFAAAGGPEGTYVLSEKYFIETRDISLTMQNSRAEKQVMSLPSQSVQQKILPSKDPGAREEYTLLAKHPALGTQGNGSLMLGYNRYFENDTVTDGPIVIWEGNNNWGDNESWGDGYYYAGLYDYPSVHFRGVNSSGSPMYSGTMRDETVLPNDVGGNTYTFEVVGDVMSADSASLSYWNWSSYGWYGAVMAENAEAYYPSEEWAWGFNSHVMSTTYTYPEMEDPSYQVDGGFINYQTDSEGYGTISWYESIGGCLSTDAAMDENSNWVADATETVTMTGVAAWDPLNETSGQHYPAIRAFDWEKTCPLDDVTAFDTLYYWTFEDPAISAERPAIDAGNNNIVCLWELHNINASDPDEVGVTIWATGENDTGNISDLDTRAYIGVTTIPDGINKVENPEICHVTGDTFIGHVTIDNELLYFVTYDGGQTWDGLYQQSPDGQVVVNEYRNCDISDEGLMSIWEYTFDDTRQGSGIRLMYTFNTVRVEGDLTYEEEDPANGCDVNITNLNISKSWTQNTGAGNHYAQILLLGVEIWSNPSTDFRFFATDGYYYNETLHTFDGALDHIMTFDMVLDQEPIHIVGARSYATHGAQGQLYIDLTWPQNVESRAAPDNLFEFDLSGSVTPGSVSASTNQGHVCTVGYVDADTISVSIDSVPTPTAWLVITLSGGASDTFNIGFCEGDSNRDRATNPTDFASTKLRFGQTAAIGNAEWDFNCDGAINPTDAASIKLRFGRALPPEP